MANRIAFSGASGTGKSTLAKYVSERYKLTINPVGSRSVAKDMGFENPYDVDTAGRRDEFQRALLRQKGEWERANEEFVTDRSVVDNLAYRALHSPYSITEETILDVAYGMARYTHVFYCPMNACFHLGDDAARVRRTAYHKVFEALLTGLHSKYLSRTTNFVTVGYSESAMRQHCVDTALLPSYF